MYKWAAALPAWQQHLIALLLTKQSLDGAERDACIELVLESAGGPVTTTQAVQLTRDDFPAPAPTVDAAKLVGLGPLRNVNAVAAGERLWFEPSGLTIVFGLNAAGKSSYVRPLKRLCRSVDAQAEILPNVFSAPTAVEPPRAKVEWRTAASTPTAREFTLAFGEQSPLTSMSVFDARCATIYVNAENEVAFMPKLLALLDRLAHEQSTMKETLELRAANSQAACRPLPAMPHGTHAAAFAAALSATTSDSTIGAAARSLTDPEITRRDELQLVVSPAARKESTARRSVMVADAEAADALVGLLDGLAAAVGDEAADRLRALREQARDAREVARVAATEAFFATSLPGVGGGPWKQLWESARSYYEADISPGATFPPTADEAECPLCYQELSPEARKRFHDFEQHVKSTAEADALTAEAALVRACRAFTRELVERCRTPVFAALAGENVKAHAALFEWLASAQLRVERLAAVASNAEALNDMPVLGPCPHQFVKAFAETRHDQVRALDADTDPAKLTEATHELDELLARQTLAANISLLKENVAHLKNGALFERAAERLTTRPISYKQRELSDRVVTQALGQRLWRELAALNLDHLAVDMTQKARSGAMFLQLRLSAATHAPETVLSEGERRALALAFFLAEIGEPGHDGGAIFDDPVSSFDHERKEVIAERIAVEAKARQVIVFTHDISFLVRLRKHAEDAGVPIVYQTIWRSGDLIGRVMSDLPFDAMTVKQRVAALADELQNIKQSEFTSPDEYGRAISSWYERLRRSWERLVEEVVLGGVVERFSPAVHTQKLKNVRCSEEIVERVERGMTRVSTWVHDQPTAENATLPGKQEMARDLDEIRELLKELRTK